MSERCYDGRTLTFDATANAVVHVDDGTPCDRYDQLRGAGTGSPRGLVAGWPMCPTCGAAMEVEQIDTGLGFSLQGRFGCPNGHDAPPVFGEDGSGSA